MAVSFATTMYTPSLQPQARISPSCSIKHFSGFNPESPGSLIRLRLDPPNKLFFPYEPGKQVKSAVGIKNTSKSHVAFKFQTTAPKSCYMRPPGGILAPGESLVATVFKFVEPSKNNEKPVDQKSRVKFKIMSLKVKGEKDYVPELI